MKARRRQTLVALAMLGASLTAFAAARSTANYTLVTDSLDSGGGAAFSASYAHRSAVESVVGVSGATIPDATARFLYHGFVPQLDRPLFPVADLAVTLTASPNLASPSEVVTYAGSVANHGTDAAPGVVLTVTLPGNVNFQGASLSQGSWTLSGNLLRCDFGTLADGGVATYLVQLTPTANGVALVTSAATAEAVEPSPADNIASAESTVVTAVHFTRPGGGSWYSPANWTPAVVPGTNHIAIIDGDIVDFYDADATVAGLVLRGGRIGGAHRLTVTTLAEWSGGELQVGLTLAIPPGGLLRVTNGNAVNLRGGSGIENRGTVRLESTALVSVFGAWVTNHGLFEIVGDRSFQRFENAGFDFHNRPDAVVRKTAGAGVSPIPVAFRNDGLVEVLAGAIDFNGSFVNGGWALINSGILRAAAGTEIRYTKANSFQHGTTFEGPGTHRVIAATMQPGDGSEFRGTIRGDLEIANGRMNGTFTNTGHLTWSGGTFQSYLDVMTVAPEGMLTLAGGADRTLVNSYGIRNLGVVRLSGAGLAASGGGTLDNYGLLDIAGDFGLQTGVVLSNRPAGILRKSAGTGTSSLSASFFQDGGTLDLRAGTVALAGNYAPAPSSVLRLHIGGTVPGAQFSRLTAVGAAVLNGTLVVVPINGFVPAAADTFQIVTAASRSDTFSGVEAVSPGAGLSFKPEYQGAGVLLRMVPGEPVLALPTLRYLNGQFEFSFLGGMGGSYVIETSPQLGSEATWQPVQTNLAGAAPISFTDPSAGSWPMRFYRAVLLP
jgi:uncharacterized repeat protein (TIGR01451 family)